MYSRAIRQLVYAQSCLLIGLVVCVIIKPDGLTANDGISYYGIYKVTVLPYAFGLLGAAWFMLRAARSAPALPFQQLKPALQIFSLATVGLLLTPYSFSNVFDWIHTTFGTILFAYQLLITGWLAIRSRPRRYFIGLWLIELLAGIACAVYLLPRTGYLFEFQVIFQVVCTIFLTSYLRLYKKAAV